MNQPNQPRWYAVAAMVVALLTSAAATRAAMLEDFEPGTSYSGPGTLEADPTDAGNQVLHLAAGQLAAFATGATAGVITMRIYDFGEIPTFNGPRWGVSDTDQSAAATIIDKSFLPASAGYGYGVETSKTGSWWSPGWFNGPRQATLDDAATTDVDERAGQWSTWTFDIATDGVVTISASFWGGSRTSGPVDAMDTIWVFAGRSGQVVDGVLVDDITFDPIPEPATIALLSVGALMGIRRRRSA